MTRTLNTKAWWGGFLITLGDLTAEPASGGTSHLTVDFTFQNLTKGELGLPVPALFVDGAQADQIYLSNSPSVAPKAQTKATAEGTLPVVSAAPEATTAELNMALDKAVLAFGAPTDNQSLMPLTTATPPTTVAPKTYPDADGDLTTPPVIVSVSDFTLAPSYEDGKKDVYVLSFHPEFRCGKQCPRGGTFVALSHFTLKTADGTVLSPSAESTFASAAVYQDAVTVGPTERIAFEVDPGLSGAATLQYLVDGTETVGSLEVTL